MPKDLQKEEERTGYNKNEHVEEAAHNEDDANNDSLALTEEEVFYLEMLE